MHVSIGDPFVDWIEPVNASGDPITGLAATLTTNLVIERPDGNPATATITEQGSTGRYRLEIETEDGEEGIWWWRTYKTAPYQRFEGSPWIGDGPYVGDTIKDWIEPISALGAPISGIAATLVTNLSSEDPDEASFTVSIAEKTTTGRYSVTFVPTEIGTHWWRTSADTPFQSFAFTIDVDDEDAESPTTPTAITSQVYTTFTNIRREIQDMLDDLFVLTATEDSTETTITDAINLFEGDDSLVSSHLVAVSGTTLNVGKLARVDGNTAALATIGFAPAFPAPVAEGDVFDLHNLNGAGWLYREIMRRVNAVLSESFPRVLIARQDTIATAFNRDDPYISVPANVTHNYSVEFLAGNDDWIEVPPHFRICHIASLKIELRGYYREMAHGKSLRLNGYGQHPQVTAESSTIYVNPRWLVLEVAARLGSQPSRNREMRTWAAQWMKEAGGMLQNATTSTMPNTERFR
jgi:hypothetical protein